jgi:hypothetical protein
MDFAAGNLLLLSTGQPKMVRIMVGAKHMGRGSQERGAVREMVNQWLKEKLAWALSPFLNSNSRECPCSISEDAPPGR